MEGLVFFKTQYTIFGSDEPQIMISKKFASKSEALKAEHDFLLTAYENKAVDKNMTFQQLFDKFMEYKKDKIKYSTYRGYQYNYPNIKCFMKAKCVNYNLSMYEAWKKKIASNKKLSTRTKNDLLKFWKCILNFGSSWYGFNFSAVYRRMTNFTNPNEKKKEMNFYTLEEFNQFLSGESELVYKCLWETLFYCGLRSGEARGLMWECIDFNKKTLTVNKQVQDSIPGSECPYTILSPKTKTSNRTIPICDLLLNDLKKYKDKVSSVEGFNEKFFVFGYKSGSAPFDPQQVRERKKKIAKSVGIKVIRTHDFRHSCASLLINNGGNITMVAKYLGHSEIEETLNIYSHMFPSALDNVINIIDKLDK